MQITTNAGISAELQDRFMHAQSVFVLTGAGVSAESGVPTFRGGGQSTLWKGMPFEVISSAAMVERDLPAVWDWFDYRRDHLKQVRPNEAHRQLASWHDRFDRLTLVTQNIDGLHQQAGSRGVLELHGSIWRSRCIGCHMRYEISREQKREDTCQACGDCLRPDVVLFGEMLPGDVLQRAAEEAANCDLCFVIGTSAIVYPAASLPEIARDAGAFVCEVNPELTALSHSCDEVLAGPAGEILPAITASIGKRR